MFRGSLTSEEIQWQQFWRNPLFGALEVFFMCSDAIEIVSSPSSHFFWYTEGCIAYIANASMAFSHGVYTLFFLLL